MIFIAVKWALRPESADSWLSLVQDFTTATRAEPGNLFFDWSRSVDDPTTYVLLEAFADDAAGAAHVAMPHFVKAMQELPPALAGTPQIINVTVPGTDWSLLSEMAPLI